MMQLCDVGDKSFWSVLTEIRGWDREALPDSRGMFGLAYTDEVSARI
jgi:hypothetical protein